MLVLFAALVAQPQPAWWNAFKQQHNRCGLVFNVDGPGPPGDGVLIEKDYRGLILSRRSARARKPLDCIATWARKNGIKVRYKNF
jgi:hypothetical protein